LAIFGGKNRLHFASGKEPKLLPIASAGALETRLRTGASFSV
jgi:hypothetical protein